MGGAIRFVFTIIWFAIGLSVMGQISQCTLMMAGRAAHAQGESISLGAWNRQLLRQKKTCSDRRCF